MIEIKTVDDLVECFSKALRAWEKNDFSGDTTRNCHVFAFSYALLKALQLKDNMEKSND